jgi:hypothetical protein
VSRRGAEDARFGNDFGNQFLNDISRLCYTRQPKISPVVNKTG